MLKRFKDKDGRFKAVAVVSTVVFVLILCLSAYWLISYKIKSDALRREKVQKMKEKEIEVQEMKEWIIKEREIKRQETKEWEILFLEKCEEAKSYAMDNSEAIVEISKFLLESIMEIQDEISDIDIYPLYDKYSHSYRISKVETEEILGIIYNGEYQDIYTELVYYSDLPQTAVYPGISVVTHTYTSFSSRGCDIVYSKSGTVPPVGVGYTGRYESIEEINEYIFIATYKIEYAE